jgi:ergothioneine biosynthesis protein EgtB
VKRTHARLKVVTDARPDAGEPSNNWKRDALKEAFCQIRRATELLCEPLETEDFVIQTAPEVSPTKWHLAHTSWFFENFVLRPGLPGYSAFDERYGYVFNSYYHAAGDRHPQPQRGLLSRPTVRQVLEYRQHVDGAMKRFLGGTSEDDLAHFGFVIELGMNHEEQHQELILTDIKHVLGANPLEPAYRAANREPPSNTAPVRWIQFNGGLADVGHSGSSFAFDNEKPRHPFYLRPFELADRPATCGEYLAFIRDGGYQRPDLWLSDGWDAVQRCRWRAPLYWNQVADEWQLFSLRGRRRIDEDEPLCHISYYEADAFARWAGARLPLEEEWELGSTGAPVEGNLLETDCLHPTPAPSREHGRLKQMFGDVWEWTASAYLPYPGFVPFSGALGEYNGKFMSNRMVLRGGSCATPRRHIRPSYRNFFPPDARWQFSGVRLARSAA